MMRILALTLGALASQLLLEHATWRRPKPLVKHRRKRRGQGGRRQTGPRSTNRRSTSATAASSTSRTAITARRRPINRSGPARIRRKGGWYGYGFPVSTYRWGWFGAERYYPRVGWHSDYNGDCVRFAYRYGY